MVTLPASVEGFLDDHHLRNLQTVTRLRSGNGSFNVWQTVTVMSIRLAGRIWVTFRLT
jgi:hypothetical protein